MLHANSIARTLGAMFLGLGALASLFAVAAVASADLGASVGLSASAGLSLFLGGALRLASRGRELTGGVREALVLVLIGWFAAPLLMCAPLIVGPNVGALFRAYFDALSALTTTGFAPAFLINETPSPVLVAYWNALQWVGGGVSILTALVVFASLNMTGPGVHRSTLFTLDPERLLNRFGNVGRATAILYVSATVTVFAFSWLGGAGPGEALCVALASVSTGALLLPDGAMTGSSLGPVVLVAAGLGLLFGALNFALHWDHARGRVLIGHVRSDETRSFVLLCLLAAAVAYFAAPFWDRTFARALFDGVSLASTAGWTAGGGLAFLPEPFILAVVLIGGSPISTAGGLKIVRLALLSQHIGAELRRLAHPSSVSDVRYRDQALPRRAVMGLLLYVIGYTGAVAFVALAASFGGAPLDSALALGAASVSNAGPVADQAALGSTGYLFRSWPTAVASAIGMILGRLEVLAALAALLPSFWRR